LFVRATSMTTCSTGASNATPRMMGQSLLPGARWFRKKRTIVLATGCFVPTPVRRNRVGLEL